MYFVYIVRCDDNSLYTGITNNLERRMKEHIYKTNKAAAYTKSRNVVSLEALWEAENRSKASKLEYAIKKYNKQSKEKLIINPDVFDDYVSIHVDDKMFKSFKTSGTDV